MNMQSSKSHALLFSHPYIVYDNCSLLFSFGLFDCRMETLEASRCFNCGSYSHSLKECPKPRDNTAINNARKQHNAKRNPTPGSRGQVRYYQKSPGNLMIWKLDFWVLKQENAWVWGNKPFTFSSDICWLLMALFFIDCTKLSHLISWCLLSITLELVILDAWI